jgi:hypothetical protein
MTKLIRVESGHAPQTEGDRSFVGGVPRLPQGQAIPTCTLCGAEQTFFFQLAFPREHEWEGQSLAVFACTSCADEDQLIPEMLTGQLRGAEVPSTFLSGYQRNFRFLVFPSDSGLPCASYQERVLFKRIRLEPSEDERLLADKVGGIPAWVLDDESPRSSDGRPLVFLLQLTQGWEFEIAATTRRQVELGLDGKPRPTKRNSYRLFLGNAIYLFGPRFPGAPLVYAITQVD